MGRCNKSQTKPKDGTIKLKDYLTGDTHTVIVFGTILLLQNKSTSVLELSTMVSFILQAFRLLREPQWNPKILSIRLQVLRQTQ